MEHSSEEVQLLKFLEEILKDLRIAINSLDGQVPPPQSGAAAYMQYVAVAINRAADGYLVLRLAYRVAASKLLIRPALDVLFAGAAIASQPDLLIRKARYEWEDEKKMFPKGPDRDAAFQELWDKFEQSVRLHEPERQINPTPISTRDLALAAGWEKIYDLVYRLYCKFTHGALRAVKGELDDSTDCRDTEIVIWCVFQALVLLKSLTPATVPDLKLLHDGLPYGARVS